MSNKINPNDPAFPFVEPNAQCNVNTGLSIRAELAARAMQGILANNIVNDECRLSEDGVAFAAVAFADALIKKLNKEV